MSAGVSALTLPEDLTVGHDDARLFPKRLQRRRASSCLSDDDSRCVRLPGHRGSSAAEAESDRPFGAALVDGNHQHRQISRMQEIADDAAFRARSETESRAMRSFSCVMPVLNTALTETKRSASGGIRQPDKRRGRLCRGICGTAAFRQKISICSARSGRGSLFR